MAKHFVFRLERETPEEKIVIKLTRAEDTPNDFVLLLNDGNDTAAVVLTNADLMAFAAAILKEFAQ